MSTAQDQGECRFICLVWPILTSLVPKCDEGRPECSRCRRIRKPCPGVYNGLFMVNAGPSSSGNGSGQSGQASISFHENNDITAERACVLPCVPDQPSPQHLFEQALLSTFIESIFPVRFCANTV